MTGLACDVRFEDQVEPAVNAVLEKFSKLDVLINNAGNVTSTPDNAPFEKRSLELCRRRSTRTLQACSFAPSTPWPRP